MRMSDPFVVAVGMVLQRNWVKNPDALYSFNAILGAHVEVEGVDDLGCDFRVLDGTCAGWQMRRGWHLITAEWFILD